jgi:hypothetical protein
MAEQVHLPVPSPGTPRSATAPGRTCGGHRT